MKYLCLAYYDEAKMAALPKAELQAIVSQCPGYDAKLRDTGRLLLSASLGLPSETINLRPAGGKIAITDGPFTESKEMIGGLFIIEAENAEEAKAIASNHPAAHLGEHIGWGIEVRPIGHCLDNLRALAAAG
jgi:hypothetical protein